MCDSFKTKSNYVSPQCQHFVLRKKRLCRMTVKPGKQYCGEHEPQPKTDDGQDDTRIPCPNDPKHTCYVSKLDKHLSICNARQVEQPDYIIQNINAPTFKEQKPRLSLSEIPAERILNVIEKLNMLFETNLKGKIETLPERPIHSAVLQEFNEPGRTESSLRHLRQASSLLHVLEEEGLVAPDTCFVELGAGKGQLSWYAWRAWGQRWAARVLLVDRAAPRHKRDNRLRELPQHQRLRADLAHLALERVPAVRACAGLVGYAKHLCGVATDYALRCVTAGGAARRLRGAVLATCCHHRCERRAHPAARRLLELGIDEDDFDVMLGLVSWATSGDGRSRHHRRHHRHLGVPPRPDEEHTAHRLSNGTTDAELIKTFDEGNTASNTRRSENLILTDDRMESEESSDETKTDSVRIKEISRITNESTEPELNSEGLRRNGNDKRDCMQNMKGTNDEIHETNDEIQETNDGIHETNDGIHETNDGIHETNDEIHETNDELKELSHEMGTKNLKLSKEQREEVGRRAKALLDWGRVLYLQECGFDARLVYYVPSSVSLENVCIIATKLSE